MKKLLALIQAIFNDIQPISVVENMDLFEMTLLCSGIKDKYQAAFESKLPLLGTGDDLRVTLVFNDEPYSYETSKASNEPFWDGLSTHIPSLSTNDKTTVTVSITKKQDITIIYSLKDFSSYLSQLSVKALLDDFNGLLNHHKKLVFASDEFTSSFSTKTIQFTISGTKSILSVDESIRTSSVNKVHSISHFTGMENCQLLPEDFYFESVENVPDQILKSFRVACMVLLLSFLNDNAYLDDTKLSIRLNGYKSHSADINLSKLTLESLDEYFKIYRWIIDQGSSFDKSGLVRNILSLNISYPSTTITKDVFTSIISGYKVYEKQNVKQYIELRNKMSDQLIGFNEKASKIIESFATGFQKSALAFVSFFSTVVVIRVLTTSNFSNIFTGQATILCLAFLAASYCYYKVSLWEVEEQRKRFIESYGNMKKRNLDLLTQEDINRILNNDTDYDSDLSFITEKKRVYSRLWKSFMLIFLFVVLILYGFDKINFSTMFSCFI